MIKLVKNNITDEGLRILLSYLSTDTYTKVLNMTNNHLTQKSLAYIV
jgi:Ran GTPase-activating protein (RanGAP) involved in mRNA processing and transport